jgi:hypothetical protein
LELQAMVIAGEGSEFAGEATMTHGTNWNKTEKILSEQLPIPFCMASELSERVVYHNRKWTKMSFLENQYYLDVATSTNFKLPEQYQGSYCRVEIHHPKNAEGLHTWKLVIGS